MMTRRELRLGFDTSGRLLETVVLTSHEGNEYVIHAMRATQAVPRPDAMKGEHSAMTTYGTTSDGTPITDEQIQAWADEAEAGYDVGVLKRRGRPRLGPGGA